LWRRGFGGRLIGRVADEQSFPHEGLALPEQALAMLVHFRPEAHFVERAIKAYMLLGTLNEDDVAVPWAADALVTQSFTRDLHYVPSKRWKRLRIRDHHSISDATVGEGRASPEAAENDFN
jgi:hypothetical protein